MLFDGCEQTAFRNMSEPRQLGFSRSENVWAREKKIRLPEPDYSVSEKQSARDAAMKSKSLLAKFKTSAKGGF